MSIVPYIVLSTLHRLAFTYILGTQYLALHFTITITKIDILSNDIML